MIRNRKITTLIMIVTIVYLTVVTFLQNPFKENYSMMTSNIKGYALVFGLCIFLTINLLNPTYVLNKKYVLFCFGPLIGCLLPYKAYSGDILSNLHEICAYIAFFFTISITTLNLIKLKTYNMKKANILTTFYLFVFLVAAYMYLKTDGVVGMEEYLLLTATIIINYVIYLEITKKENIKIGLEERRC